MRTEGKRGVETVEYDHRLRNQIDKALAEFVEIPKSVGGNRSSREPA